MPFELGTRNILARDMYEMIIEVGIVLFQLSFDRSGPTTHWSNARAVRWSGFMCPTANLISYHTPCQDKRLSVSRDLSSIQSSRTPEKAICV